MMPESLLIGCFVLSALTLIGAVLFGIVVLRRLPQRAAGGTKPTSGGNGDDAPEHLQIGQMLVPPGEPIDSVISRLSFVESFNANRFATASQESALSYLNSSLRSRASDGVVVAVNSIQLLRSGAEITFTASSAGQKMLANGTAVMARYGKTGQILPYLKDASTGKIFEHLKGVTATKALTKLAFLSTAVVGAAHMIAGADIAKRLTKVDAKLELLLVHRRIDQAATLERIYSSAKELLSGPLSRETCWEIWRLRGEVRELRCRWRSELQHHLNLVDDGKDFWWIQRMFGYESASDGKLVESITEGEVQLSLIEYSLRLDQALAVAGGTVNQFEGTLRDEMNALENLATLLKSKATSIKGDGQKLSVEPTVKAMTAMIQQYRGLFPVEAESNNRTDNNRTDTSRARKSGG